MRVLVSASWVMRYSASWALGGTANGGPVTVSRAGSPAARTLAISSSRSSRPGCGACPGVAGSRSTPTSRRISPSAERPVADTWPMTEAAWPGLVSAV